MFVTECLRNLAKHARSPRQCAQSLSDRSSRTKDPERIRREEIRKNGAAVCRQSNGPGGWTGNSPSSNSTVANLWSAFPTFTIGKTGAPTTAVERRPEPIFPMMANVKSLTGFRTICQTRACSDSRIRPVPMHAFRSFIAKSSCGFTSSPHCFAIRNGTFGNDHIANREQM